MCWLIPATLFASKTSKVYSSLNHEILIKALRNGQALMYDQSIERYNKYIEAHPDDVEIYIERCQFVELAVYDEYDDYNPSQGYLDSLQEQLKDRFPNSHSVIIYHLSYTCWDDKFEILEDALASFNNNESNWGDDDIEQVYLGLA